MSNATQLVSGVASWTFRDRTYEVSLDVKNEKLVVQVQDEKTTDQWRGMFDSRHIEELTHKTGNFKQFRIFVNMLESAIMKTSDSVSLELLTYSDLESLRKQKSHPKSQSAVSSSHAPTKRYLILTYSAEFDRIHYPLALPYVGKSDPVQLQETIRQLQKELESYKKQTTHRNQKTASTSKLQRKYEALLRDKEELESAFEALQEETEQNRLSEGGGGDKEIRTLKKIVKNLEEDLLKDRTKYQRIITKKNEEIKTLLEELDDLRSSERMLNTRVKNLTNELAILRRNSVTRNHTRSGSGNQPKSSGLSYSRRRSSSTEGRLTNTGGKRNKPSNSRIRTPSPGSSKFQRFDPTEYVENKRRRQDEINRRLGRTRSRSNSTERSRLPPRPTPPSSITKSRRINIGTRSRSSSIGSQYSLSRHSSVDCSSGEDSSRDTRYSKKTKKNTTTAKISSQNGARKSRSRDRYSPTFMQVNSSTPKMSHKNKHNDSSMMDQSMEIHEIDARLRALQQFMKKSLDGVRNGR